MRAKWIAGLVSISLVSAIAASVLTIIFLMKGFWGFSLTWPETSASVLPENTTTQGSTAAPTPTTQPLPTLSPTPEPTPTDSVKPTPTPDPLTNNAVEQTYLWQTRNLMEKIYTKVSPSVVGIKVEAASSSSTSRQTNEGSGLIVDKNGSIVTNASIINIALDKQGKVQSNASIQVMLAGQSQPFTATLIGRDPMTGLAVLSIKPGSLTLIPATITEKTEIKIGQMILALGYPNLQVETGGLSSGLVCGLNRSVVLEDGTTVQMIQTDARLGQNCAGGPLVNLQGEVIGLFNNTLARESIDAMSYALPASTMMKVAGSLIQNGYVSGRSWLGVSIMIEDSFLELQKLYMFPDGLYVSSVVKDSPAYSADIRKGDIIVRINGHDVGTSMDLSKFLQSQPVGTLVKIDVYRRSDGQNHELKVYLQEYTH